MYETPINIVYLLLAEDKGNASQVSKSENVDHNCSYMLKLNAQLRARNFVRLSGYEYFCLKSLMY